MKSSFFALVTALVVYSTGYASQDRQKIKLKSVLINPGTAFNTKRNDVATLDTKSSTIPQQDASKFIKNQNIDTAKKNGNVDVRKLKLKSKSAAKKNAVGEKKRQDVLMGDPNQQRLFHIDETGTLHRHEVGPEEFSTPEGRTETFSNDKLLTEENLSELRPSQDGTTEASTRQMLAPPKGGPSLSALPGFKPGTPVAFVQPPPLPAGPPQPYYLMASMHKPSDPTTRGQTQSDRPAGMSKLQRVFIHRLPFPVPGYGNHPYPLPYPMFNSGPVPIPVPVEGPPKIERVPYPVPVPVQSPPQIRIQKVPVAIPQPVPVPQVQKVPVPVPVQSPPQIRIQKVPVPVPQPVPIPQPIPYPHVPMTRRIVRPGPIIPVPVGLSECETSPCRNGGTCYSVDDIESYRCHCTSGFKGRHCEDTSKCHPNPCENMGECTVLQSGYECSCRRGFRGTRCEVRDQCHPSPCRNGGSCTSVANDYGCSCIYGFIGKNCEVESKCFPLNPCKHGGTCHEDDANYKCTCTPGWDGISCEIPDPCSRNPCYHGGLCRNQGSSYTCSCPKGFLGKSCEIESQCHSSKPCRNGGTCHEHDLDGYRCHCQHRWTGDHCEIPSFTSY